MTRVDPDSSGCEHARVDVRRMQSAELEAVIELWNETCVDTYDFIETERSYSFDDRRSFFLARIEPTCELWVASDGGLLLGYLALRESYVDRLYVRPKAQRSGAGAALIGKARARSPDGLELHTHVKNGKARAFYEKEGFVAVRFGVSPAPESEPDVEYHWRPARLR
jgi:ribosomal protein S18 acetylase RimI-like enzyme